jgi:hypothetical protein
VLVDQLRLYVKSDGCMLDELTDQLFSSVTVIPVPANLRSFFDHSVPKVLSKFLFPLDKSLDLFVCAGCVPHRCCQYDVSQSIISAELLEHVDVPQRRALHTVVGDLMEIDDSG